MPDGMLFPPGDPLLEQAAKSAATPMADNARAISWCGCMNAFFC